MNYYKQTILIIATLFLYKSVSGQTESSIIRYSVGKDYHLLFDYYHHNLPATKVGNYILTGSWINSDGRYGWNDFVHTNSFDHAYSILSKDYSISMSRVPYSEKVLNGIDGAVIFAADNPNLIPNAKTISDDEISVLTLFVKNGGSLMVMLNAVEGNRFNESFETLQMKKLLEVFGLGWNNNDTHYSDNLIPAGHPYFYDISQFHYGAGCTLKILSNAVNPKVMLNVYSDSTYNDRSVNGPGIVKVKYGKGKVILVGDAGSWTGNMSRPWVAGLQAIPGRNTLSKLSHPNHKMFSPRPITNMPYFEVAADIKVTPQSISNLNANQLNMSLNSFKRFNESIANIEAQSGSMLISKQGKASDINTIGSDFQWLAPELSIISALIPVDGVKVKDSWQSIESIRIPALRGTDLPTVKRKDIEILYERDTIIAGVKCRLFVSNEEAWLSDWGINVEDLLPQEEVKRVGGINYEYLHERGGKILFKREQWVDIKTGLVLEARMQSRIITWIQDKRKSVAASNLDKDNESIVSLANIITYKLKEIN